jgi:transcriptional regulator of NAD metabolism
MEIDPAHNSKRFPIKFTHGNEGHKMKYEVVVGNIGTISAKDRNDAIKTYREYVKQSKCGKGRAAGEAVCIIEDGEPMPKFDYLGTLNLNEDESV